MAMRGVHIFTTLISFLFMLTTALAEDKKSYLARGSSVSTEDDTKTILVSPNGDFACGFYKIVGEDVAWTANRDAPVNGKGSRLTFRKNGSLALVDYNGTVVWRSNTTATRASFAKLLDNGNLVVVDSEDQCLWRSFDSPTDTLLPLQPMTRDTKLDVMRRLTLDYDGNLRLYSLNATNGKWSVSWLAFPRVCEIHGLCGKNSFCTYMPSLQCSCLEGFEMTEPSDWSQGCRRKENITVKPDHNANDNTEQRFIFVEIPKTDFYGYDFNYTPSVTLPVCKQICLNDDGCEAFAYRKGKGECYPKALLINGKKFPDPSNEIYLKFSKVSSSQLLASKPSHICKVTEKDAYPSLQMFEGSNSKFNFGYFLSSALTLLVVEVILVTVVCWAANKWGRRPEIQDEGYTIISSQFRRFSYKELEKATEFFQEELGSGGSGAVYKGILDDNRKVAVKKLNDVIQGDQEFKSELSIIGRVYHMNLVRIWGYCAEKTHKLLVSEFVENGSLDRVLSDHLGLFPVLQWSQRYNIALGVAKGLAYLHHECLEWIVHCDVKPENILLDKDFEPKIADFGLVKLLSRGSNTHNQSKVHGTRGYIAPEWALNLPITGKADVYSYGVVLP
uniref:non-specific serine/threonine protein kinase n=1 Tax=Oryza rufipogon TaxID=4529 RepID=A0A0E0PTZ3_ORYRU